METISAATTAVPSTSRRSIAPSRTQSTRTATVPPTKPHRSGSSSSRPKPLDNLSKRDAETTNLTRPRRNSINKERPVPSRIESARSGQHKSSSRPHDSQYQSEMSGSTAVAQGSGPAPVMASAESKNTSNRSGRSRTTIPAKTGNWVLGKTIGAGSMGKVKLARRAEGGEQVRYI